MTCEICDLWCWAPSKHLFLQAKRQAMIWRKVLEKFMSDGQTWLYVPSVSNANLILDPEPGRCPTSYYDKIWVYIILPILLTWEEDSVMEAGRKLWYVVMRQDLPVYCWEHQTSEQEACRQVRAWSLQHAKSLWWNSLTSVISMDETHFSLPSSETIWCLGLLEWANATLLPQRVFVGMLMFAN